MSHVIDVTEADFIEKVITASDTTPVLVDFWATWCGPCQNLMPVLTKLAEDYQGKFILAKVEIDQQPGLATQFGVRSVPTVKLLIGGQVVDEFTGALSENQIREFLDKHMMEAPDSPLQQAITLFANGSEDQALEAMQSLLLAEPDNPQVRIEFANMLMRVKRFDDARELLNSLSFEQKQDPTVITMQTQLDSITAVMDAPDIDELVAKIEQSPDDCLLREQLSAHYKLRGDYNNALEQLLEIVRMDRTYKDDFGRTEIIRIFDSLGHDHELVGEYRRKLARLLN